MMTDSDILNIIYDMAGELYMKMRDKSSNVEQDHMEIIMLLSDLGRKIVNADSSNFWTLDRDRRIIWTNTDDGQRVEIPEGKGMVGKAIKEGRTIMTNDPYRTPGFDASIDRQTGHVTRSILILPISNSMGEFIGAYEVVNKIGNGGRFNLEEDTRRLMLAAFICSLTLESDLFLADSQKDRLTRVRNRIAFYNDFELYYSSVGTTRRNRSQGALIMCDIDHFKTINDTYGHNAGDAVLCDVADILTKGAGDDGTVYRWGGEEFVIILKDKTIEDAAGIAERIRKMAEKQTTRYENKYIKLTISFGCGVIVNDKTPEENIAAVDKRLYIAKNSGRNRVVIEG